MAKKPNRNELNFYESLSNAAERFSAPFYGDTALRAKAAIEGLARRIGERMPDLLADTKAAIVDAHYYTMLAIGKAVGPSARRVYKAGAITTAGLTTIAALFLANATYTVYANDIASPQALLNKKNTGTTILDRNGQVLFQVYGANNRKPIDLQEVPKNMVNATLAAEDPSFYNEPGISWRGTARAVVQDLTNHSKLQGGSTLTQQLVKNALLTPDKSYVRKLQEIILAIEIEHRYSKDQIMQMYLNEVYYGQGSFGIESAAQTYFHKSAKDLDLSESAMLAGLPLGPSRFDPNIDPDAAKARRDFVLERMQQLGLVDQASVAAAEAEPISANSRQVEIRAPHFVFYVLDELRQKYGDDLVEHGGITIYTTLDLNKEEMAEKLVHDQILRLSWHHVTNGGLISMDPNTGDIISMVGSYDYNDPNFGKVNVTLSQLQPGSSFKPFAYVTAFKKGWNGATTVDDVPISLPNGDGTLYKPQNYDLRFHGTVTLRHALDNSLNIPAVKVLQFAGIPDTLQTAKDMGITTLGDPSQYGLSLVLGAGDVRPIDMATAYGVFATGGHKVQPRSIIKVLDRDGVDITKPDIPPSTQALDPRLAYMITNILSDNSARQPEFPANSPLKLSRPAAAKTGTTNDFRDNWTVGYTPDVVTAVWVGNNDHTPMSNVDGITGAAPIWHDYMENALSGTPIHNFIAPAGVVSTKVCFKDGGLLNPWDGGGYDEIFLAEHPQTRRCSTQAPPPPAQPTDQPPADQTNQNGQGSGTPQNGSNNPATTPPPSTEPKPPKPPTKQIF